MTREADQSSDYSSNGDALGGTGYRAVRLLFSGASSEVYEARGEQGEIRAVKVLRSMYARSSDAALRLAQEGRALRALNHRHIVKVFYAGATADGRPYVVMERLVGETLRQRLDREGRLSAARAAALLLGVLDGLDAAHRAGIVHRDVKPSNVFLHREDGRLGEARAVLLDFGVAKLEGADVGPTTSGHVIGTPRYLAPEQILAGRVDARTDVYAMGLVLFEAIAGRGPYDADGAVASMNAHICARPHPLRRFVRVSAALEQVVARALRKEPDRRWPSAGALAVALSRAAAEPEREAASRTSSLWSRVQ